MEVDQQSNQKSLFSFLSNKYSKINWSGYVFILFISFFVTNIQISIFLSISAASCPNFILQNVVWSQLCPRLVSDLVNIPGKLYIYIYCCYHT